MSLSRDKTLVFAGEFKAGYFMRRYGFDYVSAYDGENEPSMKRMAEILRFIDDNHTRYIFSDSSGISAVTRSISEQTGADILIFNSCERVNDYDMSFLRIMQDNGEALKAALND